MMDFERHEREEQRKKQTREIMGEIFILPLDVARELFVSERPAPLQKAPAGRNNPCPCGSSKKFKKCCLKGDSK